MELDPKLELILTEGRTEDWRQLVTENPSWLNYPNSRSDTIWYLLRTNEEMFMIAVQVAIATAEVDSFFDSRLSVLHVAAEYGYVEAIRRIHAFLNSEISDRWINQYSDEKQSAIHSAILGQQEAVVRCLIQLGANLNLRNAFGLLPLEFAVECRAIACAWPLAIARWNQDQAWSSQLLKIIVETKQDEMLAMLCQINPKIDRNLPLQVGNPYPTLLDYVRNRGARRCEAILFAITEWNGKFPPIETIISGREQVYFDPSLTYILTQSIL